MFIRSFVLTGCALGVALIAAPSTQGSSMLTTVNRLTFSAPVTLPGVVLLPGTYTFEAAPLERNHTIVRVLSADHRVSYLGFTVPLSRPRTMDRSTVLAFGEAPRGAPQPIDAWYPIGSHLGHRFIYR